jgi:hypothetical protein
MAALTFAATLMFALLTPPADVTEDYHRFFEARDADGLAAVWIANPGAILVTIDADLEASLSLWEANPSQPDAEAVTALHDRAVWGAEVASRATGRSIFADYASAFVGWTTEQKVAFRGGQQAFGRARGALGERDLDAALEAARECRDLALPLGDWWGAAMGLSMEGQVLLALDRSEEAVVPLEQGRLIYANLGLTGSEYGVLRAMVDVLANLERWPRARVAADHAAAMAEEFGDTAGLSVLLGRRREAELALGMDDAAARTAEKLEALTSDG